MWEWFKATEKADFIFYGLFLMIIVAEILLRYILKVAKSNKILEYIDSAFIAFILAWLIRIFLIQTFVVPSGSMKNTLLIGDRLIGNKFIYGTILPFTDGSKLKFRDPKRGDIVIFKYPPNPRHRFVKRCVGTPGDKVEIKNKVLYINDQAIKEVYTRFEDDTILPAKVSPRDNFGPVQVPVDNYFMLGDNRDYSADSRIWGFVPRKLVEGKAWLIYWPINRWKILE